MSEPTPREDEIDKIFNDVYWATRGIAGPDRSDDSSYFYNGKLEEDREHFKAYVNTEVLAVLNELEEQAEPVDYKNVERGKTIPFAVRVSAITQLKQRYGGKEQK